MDLMQNGRVAWIFSDHFDVDLIIGMQNVRENDISKLIPICMSAFTEGFSEKTEPGDILVAGRNFGYGHAHRQCMETIRRIGINTILAESFAPGFFRGEVSNGMMLLKVPHITSKVSIHDELSINFAAGIVKNITANEVIFGEKPAEVIIRLVETGGNSGFLKQKLRG
jgi:3-isopropylmalate/(R)-2-methylmalate dehydratase small subunit